MDFDTLATVTGACGMWEAVDSMACDLLARVHEGWENDQGAHGEFTPTVADQSFTLDCNERYTMTNHHWHEF